ncbi:MAG: hypothetical protein Q8N73_01690 [bacterium]|nr:hypothetical protein [bacterium]
MLHYSFNQRGIAALLITNLILVAVFGIAVSIFALTYGEQKIIQNIVKTNQAYYAAEAGIEDALLRLSKNMKWSSLYNLNVGSALATIETSDVIGGSRTITSTGNFSNRIRKIQAVYKISADQISFHYGAQVGDGGIKMDNNSKIIGNVFSNGSLDGDPPNVEIQGTIKIAGTGKKFEGAKIFQDAFSDICENSQIIGELHVNTQINCTSGSSFSLGDPISPIPLPISDSRIDQWKDEAAAGGTIGSVNLSGSDQISLGPKRIEGNLIVQNNAILTITGTLLVTGIIDIKNLAQVRLDPQVYGNRSGVIIADGLITLQNDSISSGSGQSGSYLMYLSTASTNPAISIKNNAIVDILYTNNGWIVVENNAAMREITGYGIHIKNNTTVTYEIGLQDATFISGPGGGWTITDWKEIE